MFTTKAGPVMQVNELEFIDHFIYANVYETSTIIKIDTSTGKVAARLELGSLATDAKSRYAGSMEMNGIAYDPVLHKIYVTGKMWPTLYEIHSHIETDIVIENIDGRENIHFDSF
jgi:glutamine cyclotransferase